MNRNLQSELESSGYTIIDNFLDDEIANKLHNIFSGEPESSWGLIDQTREGHYSHVFKTENSNLPDENEIYFSKFSRSQKLEQNSLIESIFSGYFRPRINEICNTEFSNFDMRCHRQVANDFCRVHMDDYASDFNLIYYVNKSWKWDWGGILHICDYYDKESIEVIFPKFNRLVLLNNKKFRKPHFISPVQSYARSPRYSIVSFNSF